MRPELKNKPLVEALLELHWFPEPAPAPFWRDEAYPVFVGPFFESVREDYPFIEPLDAVRNSRPFTPGVVKYRFRRAPNEWPVIQVGPVLCIPELHDFLQLGTLRRSGWTFLTSLIDSYQVKGAYSPPFFSWSMLRYINATNY